MKFLKYESKLLRSAVFTGRSYGDGIYLANVFDKSFGYTSGFSDGSKYLLLCDVVPGKSKHFLQVSN
jgi:Poly(ADP-ribose) polymerase catalytic domain